MLLGVGERCRWGRRGERVKKERQCRKEEKQAFSHLGKSLSSFLCPLSSVPRKLVVVEEGVNLLVGKRKSPPLLHSLLSSG